MEVLHHFSHKHPLLSYREARNRPLWKFSNCRLCGQKPGYGSIYGCKKCGFFVHWVCARLSQHLSHPFHPEHVLSLYVYDHNPTSNADKPLCSACGITCSSHVYHCGECNFYLDDRCIQIIRQSITPPKSSHPHPLISCSHQSEQELKFACSFCRTEIYSDNIFFTCFHCKILLHWTCAHLPRQIRHPFHIEHTLNFSRKHYAPTDFKCNACFWSEGIYFIRDSYICSQCDFHLHKECASLFPITGDASKSDGKQMQNQPPCTHSHPLIECDGEDTSYYRYVCSGCNLTIKGSVFVCLKCGILLDKSCAQLLPQIRHPFHPMHPLSLYQNIEKKHRFECRGCRETAHFFTYVCWKCDFHLDPLCAMTRTPRMIKSRVHMHPLAFLKKKLFKVLLCSTCGGPCEDHFFQCMECKFGLHLECHPELPKIIKHSCHCDPLKLTYSRIEDKFSEDDEDIADKEFYCYACEEIRDPDDPSYCCEECPFVAHLHCVMSEIVYHIETDSLTANTELGTSEENVEGFEDEAQANSTDVPAGAKAKKKVATVDGEIVKENIVAKDEDMISKKKFAKPENEIVKPNLTPQDEDMINQNVTAPEEEILNVAAEDEGIILTEKVPGPYEDIVKEKVTKPDKDTMKDRIAEIDEDIAAIQTKIKELKERRNQFLHLERSVHKKVKHPIRKILALCI